MTDALEAAGNLLARAREIVALTGAGVSTESGLPDFRSSGGLWAGVNPLEVASLTAFRRRPQAFYDFYRRRLAVLAQARPNAAHYALVDLERFGLRVVITQNVDGLHQAAGSRRVVELHGNLREAVCLRCGRIEPMAVITEALDRGALPSCRVCGDRLKPNVVLFEELLPPAAYAEAEEACRRADVLLVAGSSLQVTPAAWLPEVARSSGARVIIVNNEPTAMDDLADVVIRGRAGEMLPALVGEVAARRQDRQP
ncbi:MAG TPA: NAD-dependent deacylase [bacterium]|nr:NAD-dependent deacylase [bacterium]